MSAISSRLFGYVSLMRYYKTRFVHAKSRLKARTYVSLNELLFGDDAKKIIKNRDYFKAAGNYPVSKMVNGRYVTPWSGKTEKSLFDTMKYMITVQQRNLPMPDKSTSASHLKSVKVDRTKILDTTKPHFTWLGHASNYYQTDGVFFLTDPVFSDRVFPVQFAGPKRLLKPSVQVEELPIDIVLLSHTHYDHLDYNTACRIGNKALWLVPLGVKKTLKGWGIDNCVEMDWWESYHHLSPTGATMEIVFTPAKHWTARHPFDRNKCLWGGFVVISKSAKFYFAGDTAYCVDFFKDIGRKYGPFDLAALPIGDYFPRWFMKDIHCNPAEALKMHADIRAKKSVAVHWGTYHQQDEDCLEPALELARARHLANVKPSEFSTVAQGETLRLNEHSKHDMGETRSDLYKIYLDALRKEVDS